MRQRGHKPLVGGEIVKNWIEELAGVPKPIIGMVHLPPMPGNPRATLSPDEIVEEALKTASLLYENGVPLLMVENFGDYPYPKYHAREEVLGLMSIIVWRIKRELGANVGVNVLRNCGVQALSIAHVSGGSFIRVNALSQTIVTDQGIIEPIAYEIMHKKASLRTKVKIMADVNVKHSAPIAKRPLIIVAKETVYRGGADALILTGETTGAPPDPRTVNELSKSLGSTTPMVIGSGINPDNIGNYFGHADAFIVGTYFKDDEGKVNSDKVRGLVKQHGKLLKKHNLV